MLAKDIYAPLALSATAQSSLRTDDAAAQPLFGYGLELHRDDFARLATFIGNQHGEIDGVQLLDPDMLRAAPQRDPQARGPQIGRPSCRGRVCQDVSISGEPVPLKKK